ncbi:MAG TPA: PP2C family protein-serine/threonine phosphatase [Phycisphaerales bacterium]|nr:PP2C family protein-serine/threonine phosphatase [Phycisphaerales bacterium]
MSLIASMNLLSAERSAVAAERTIAVLTGGRRDQALSDSKALIEGHWPEATRPRLTVYGLADALGRKDVLDALRACDGALVCAGDHDSPAELRSACALLNEHAVPAVVHLPASLAHLSGPLQAMGCMVHFQGRGDAVLAAMLAGVSQRQQALREMEVELRSRRASQKQVHSWVSKVDNELLLASKLQRELMRTDDFNAPGLTASVVYRPAWYVSGDVYRLVRLDEHHAGFLVADAMGHGISAAMYGMIIANGLTMKEVGAATATSAARYKLLEPAAALEKINGLLLNEESDQTRFASAVCGRVNLKTGALSVSSAGHPPAMVFGGRAKKARQYDSTGPVLGVFGESTFDQHAGTLESGETLVLFTDGFAEIVGESQVEEYLAETIDSADGDVRRATVQIERFLDGRPGSLTPGDDATVLMIRRA